MFKGKFLTLLSFVFLFKNIRNVLLSTCETFFRNVRPIIYLTCALVLSVFSLWIIVVIGLVLWLHDLTDGWAIPLLAIGLLQVVLIQVFSYYLNKKTRQVRLHLPDVN